MTFCIEVIGTILSHIEMDISNNTNAAKKRKLNDITKGWTQEYENLVTEHFWSKATFFQNNEHWEKLCPIIGILPETFKKGPSLLPDLFDSWYRIACITGSPNYRPRHFLAVGYRLLDLNDVSEQLVKAGTSDFELVLLLQSQPDYFETLIRRIAHELHLQCKL